MRPRVAQPVDSLQLVAVQCSARLRYIVRLFGELLCQLHVSHSLRHLFYSTTQASIPWRSEGLQTILVARYPDGSDLTKKLTEKVLKYSTGFWALGVPNYTRDKHELQRCTAKMRLCLRSHGWAYNISPYLYLDFRGHFMAGKKWEGTREEWITKQMLERSFLHMCLPSLKIWWRLDQQIPRYSGKHANFCLAPQKWKFCTS